ncbi:nuclease [Brucella endophytica]|uniref:Nuclease n=1 Tax=Brucella endophytica TaxID=1963359 RepID=A0A916WIG5_9HYPH|nr:thermonuclease family protein [Brucella endophytica]GGB00840.1 nuclease [Brucella endophytica]
MNWKPISAAFLSVLSAVVYTHDASAGSCTAVARGACVIDGDTITVNRERIRIANVDAPEISRPKCDAERRLGLVAKRRLAELLAAGEPVIKRGDPDSGRIKDRYGRTLATITVNGKDVGEALISEMLARPWGGKRRSWCE